MPRFRPLLTLLTVAASAGSVKAAHTAPYVPHSSKERKLIRLIQKAYNRLPEHQRPGFGFSSSGNTELSRLLTLLFSIAGSGSTLGNSGSGSGVSVHSGGGTLVIGSGSWSTGGAITLSPGSIFPISGVNFAPGTLITAGSFQTSSGSVQVTLLDDLNTFLTIPEPTVLALASAGLLAGLRRRRN